MSRFLMTDCVACGEPQIGLTNCEFGCGEGFCDDGRGFSCWYTRTKQCAGCKRIGCREHFDGLFCFECREAMNKKQLYTYRFGNNKTVVGRLRLRWKGRVCRLLACATMNSRYIEFVDNGETLCCSGNALRKLRGGEQIKSGIKKATGSLPGLPPLM